MHNRKITFDPENVDMEKMIEDNIELVIKNQNVYDKVVQV